MRKKLTVLQSTEFASADVVTLAHTSQFIDSFTKFSRQMGGFSRDDIVGTKTGGFGFLLILSRGRILL